MHFVTVHLSWFTVYKYLCPDSRVLCFALRSGQIEWVSIPDSPSALELSLKIQPSILFQYPVFQWCILLLFCCILFNSDVSHIYIVASWTTISFTSAAFLTLCLCSVIFIYCIFWDLPNFIYNAVFWAIQVRHVRMRMVENTWLLHLVLELWHWGKT